MKGTSFTELGYMAGETIGWYKGLFTGLIIGSVVTAGILYYLNDFSRVQSNSTNPFNKSNLQTTLEQK